MKKDWALDLSPPYLIISRGLAFYWDNIGFQTLVPPHQPFQEGQNGSDVPDNLRVSHAVLFTT